MPDRIIKEKCRTSPSLNALSDRAERLFWRLVTAADDYGSFDADLQLLLCTCFPRKVGEWVPEDLAAARTELASAVSEDVDPIIALYRVKGRVYGQILSWQEHQRKRESKPKFPNMKSPGAVRLLAAGCGEWPRIAGVSESRERETRDESGSRISCVTKRIHRMGEDCPPEVRVLLGIGKEMP